MRWVMRLRSVAPFTAMTLMFAALALSACGSDADSFEVAPTEVTKVREEAREGYTFIEYMAKQPAFRDGASDEYVEQRVYVGIQDGIAMDAPVVFQFGQEFPIAEDFVANAAAYIDMPVIVVDLEHRGLGESISSAEDQTTPLYVSAREAVEDAHGVVSALQETYTGPWFALGQFYAGGAVLQYAATHPDDLAGVNSSSGLVDLPAITTTFEPFVRELLGEEAYAALINHMKNLEPVERFDSNWLDREFLEGIVAGITQDETYQSLVPTITSMMTTMTTEELITDLRQLDQVASGGEGAAYATQRALTSLSREEALQMQPYRRSQLWLWCTDTGIPFASEGDGIYQRDEEDWDAECQAVFGVGLVKEHAGHRQDVMAMENAGVPLVYASGGKDPFSPRGLEVPPESALIDQQERWSVYETSYGLHFHAPNGYLNPPSTDQELAQATWRALFELAEVEVGTVE